MKRPGVLIPVPALSVALGCVLFLIYASSFTMDYLTLDEVGLIGTEKGWSDYYYYALAHGRLLCFFRPLVYMFVEYDPVRIQVVRFASFAAMAGIAVILFCFLHRESGRPLFAFFTTLLFFSQLTFQAISAYSLDLVAFYLQPMFWSLAAFWLHFYFFPKRATSKWKANGAVFLFLLAAMQSGQTWAFFGMVPLSFLVLAGGRERVAQARTFILLAVAVTAVSIVAYQIGLAVLHAEGRPGYARGEATMNSLTSNPLELALFALDPRTYWSAFKLWNYPFPFHNLPASGRRRELLALMAMAAWMLLVVVAMATELRARPQEKGLVVAKWLGACACLAFGGLLMLADSATVLQEDPADRDRECRPHLTMVMSGVCIFMAARALLVLSSRFQALDTKLARAIGIAAVTMTALGAQSGLLRGYVDNRGDQLDFIRTELAARPPEDFDRIMVVLPPRESLCISEPCDRFSGRVTHRKWHERRPERYKYAMASMGVSPDGVQFVFVSDDAARRDRDLVVDWRKYYAARKAYAQSLRAR